MRTGAQEAANQTSELEEQLGFLRTFLLIFAYVALVVGAFIIFNTISITVAQRTREFGLLRTLGASRGQIMRAVVEEGLLLGVVGAVIGLFAGIGLAPALDGLFKAFGADLPDNGTVLEARTVIVSLGVGIVVTVARGLLPGAARDARAADRGDARGRADPAAAAAHPAGADRSASCCACVVVVGLDDSSIGGRRRAADRCSWSRRCAAALWARLRRHGERPARHHRVVPALAGAHRLARELARDHRAPRARELGAPARPHARDRARADRRARARRVHLGARRGHQGDDRPAPSAAPSPAT